jgi:hypothetical protein
MNGKYGRQFIGHSVGAVLDSFYCIFVKFLALTNLKKIQTASPGFNRFLLFFEKLSAENKAFVIQLLSEKTTHKKRKEKAWESLKGSVLAYVDPFEPVASEDWEVMS